MPVDDGPGGESGIEEDAYHPLLDVFVWGNGVR